MLSKVVHSLLGSCGQCCKGVKIAILLGLCMGFSTKWQRLQVELAGLQAMAGALGCVEATMVVRRRRGTCQRANEVAAVACGCG